MADTEVTVEGYGHHYERWQRNLGGDEKLIQLAQQVVVDVVTRKLDEHREGDDDEAGEEVNEGQCQDEELRSSLVAHPAEDKQHQSVAHGTHDCEERQHGQQRHHLAVDRRRGVESLLHQLSSLALYLLPKVSRTWEKWPKKKKKLQSMRTILYFPE